MCQFRHSAECLIADSHKFKTTTKQIFMKIDISQFIIDRLHSFILKLVIPLNKKNCSLSIGEYATYLNFDLNPCFESISHN